MIQKKVCMLGSYAVGKTSLVSRFVSGIFSDSYLTTVGVKIDRKEVMVDDRVVNLILWDIHGEDELQTVQMSYLRGSAGYLLVVDGTRASTLDTALQLQARAEGAIGKVPFILILNKSDISRDWEIGEGALKDLAELGWTVVRTSAKTGRGVEDAFYKLSRETLGIN